MMMNPFKTLALPRLVKTPHATTSSSPKRCVREKTKREEPLLDRFKHALGGDAKKDGDGKEEKGTKKEKQKPFHNLRDYGAWLESYTHNVPSAESAHAYYRMMYEELLKMVDTSECLNDMPNPFTTALASDLLWKLTETSPHLTTEEKRRRQQVHVGLLCQIYSTSARDIKDALSRRDGVKILFEKMVPHYETSKLMQQRADELENECNMYRAENALMDVTLKRIDQVLRLGIKKWQSMICRSLFDHWRQKTRTLRMYREHFNVLSRHVKRVLKRHTKKNVFIQWREIAHMNRYDVKNKKLIALEEHVHMRTRERESLKEELETLERRLRELKARRASMVRQNTVIKSELLKAYEMDVVGEVKKKNIANLTERSKDDDDVGTFGDHINRNEIVQLVRFSKVKVEFLKAVLLQYGFADDINDTFREMATFLAFMSDDLRDVFCFYAKMEGGGRTLSEDEVYKLFQDSNVVSTKSANDSAIMQRIFRTVTIHDSQFVDGHCELSPETYIEVLVRVACEKYRSGSFSSKRHRKGGTADKSLFECFKMLCDEHIFTQAMRHDADLFRRRVYGNLGIRVFLVEFQDLLSSIFLKYASVSPDDDMYYMKIKGFVELVDNANLHKFGFTHGLVNDIFNSVQHFTTAKEYSSSSTTTKNERYRFFVQDDHLVTFDEFIEAVAACACFRYPSPYMPMADKFKDFVAEITPPILKKKAEREVTARSVGMKRVFSPQFLALLREKSLCAQ